MILIDGSDDFEVGIAGSPTYPLHSRNISSFFVDKSEFSYADFERTVSEEMPLWHRSRYSSAEHPMPVNFDQAVAYAEEVGKRLPTEFEYEYVATNRGRTKYPWGDELSEDTQNPSPDVIKSNKFGPQGDPEFDRLSSNDSVSGLCSNLAEWTSSKAISYNPTLADSRLPDQPDVRVARGGNATTLHGDPSVTPATRNPRFRFFANRNIIYEGLGFRCVRSAVPRFIDLD